MTALLVAGLIAVFLCADWLVRRRRERSRAALASARAAAPAPRLPRGVFFARSHTWLHLFSSGRAWLGIDDFVAHVLGRPRVRLLTRAGARVVRGEPLFALEDAGRGLTIRSPIDARVVAVNPEIAERAVHLDGAPFFDAWILELEPERAADVKGLLLGEETTDWMREELRRLRDLLARAIPAPGAAAQHDGGAPAAGAMRHLPAEVWSRFQREFLDVR